MLHLFDPTLFLDQHHAFPPILLWTCIIGVLPNELQVGIALIAPLFALTDMVDLYQLFSLLLALIPNPLIQLHQPIRYDYILLKHLLLRRSHAVLMQYPGQFIFVPTLVALVSFVHVLEFWVLWVRLVYRRASVKHFSAFALVRSCFQLLSFLLFLLIWLLLEIGVSSDFCAQFEELLLELVSF